MSTVAVKFTTDSKGRWYFNYRSGNPLLEGTPDYGSLKAPEVTAFLRYLWIKGKVKEVYSFSHRLGAVLTAYSHRPLWILNKEDTALVKALLETQHTLREYYNAFKVWQRGNK